ncbi:MAG: aryl-sulfate sulfotransferase [Methanomassiliicoccaceae archaeon]|nr:aryl-sulfate sulfotransferase [Methanomassiliicoccaceae archaeon]
MEKSHYITIFACCAVFIVALVIGYGLHTESSNTLHSDQTMHLRINGCDLEIPLSDDGASYDTKTLNVEFPNTFELLNRLSGISVTVNGQKLSTNSTVAVNIAKIAYDEKITLTISDGKDTHTIYIRTLNSGIPAYTAAGQSPYEGHYYITLLTLPVMLKLDQSGEIVYYLCANEYMDAAVNIEDLLSDPDSVSIVMSYWDFKKHVLPNGKIRYSYHEQDPNYNRLNMFGYAGGVRVIMDETYKEIDRIKMAANTGSSVDVVEGHDFYFIDDGHYIISNYEVRLVHNIPAGLKPQPQGSKVVASHLQEVKNGKVLLDWYSTDHAELYALSEAGYNDYANIGSQQPDYVHFNSVEIDPKDGNLICSFRNLSTILKIDRNTGDIIWKLSGKGDEFGLTKYQKTSNQHFVRLTEDGYITIFDNNVSEKKTRILKLKIDEGTKKLADWKEYIVPGHFSLVCGSAINLEKEVFVVGWGLSMEDFATMTEIDFGTQEKLFELTFPNGLNATYRCLKYQ